MKYVKQLDSIPSAEELDLLNEDCPFIGRVVDDGEEIAVVGDKSYITIKYDIPTAGEWYLLGNRTSTRYFSAFTDNIVEMYVDDVKVENPTMNYTFDTTSEHVAKFVFKHTLPSLYCFSTTRQGIEREIDLTHFDGRNVEDLLFAFEGLSNAEKISGLEKLNDAKINNLLGVFQSTSKVKTLNVSGWNVGDVTSMSYMFNQCYNLVSVGDLSNWNVENITSMKGMFQSCSCLTSLGDLSNWNVGNVTDMSYMFISCYVLTSLGDLSNWNVGNVTDMSAMFQSCSGLTSIGDLSNWNVGNVTNMSWMFNRCHKLTSLGDLSNWNVGNVTNMHVMFGNCYKLTSLGDLSSWNTSKVTDMSNMFGVSMSYLNELNTPNEHCHLILEGYQNWDVSNVTNMEWMFQKMHEMEEYDLTKWNISKVISMGGMFDMNSNATVSPKLKTVKMGGQPNANVTCEKMFGNLHTNGKFYYNSAYDYSKILVELPTEWEAIPCTLTDGVLVPNA